MLVNGFFVTLRSFEPPLPQGECASCGRPAEAEVKVARQLTAPYCASCARRTRFVWRFFLTSVAMIVPGLLLVILPVLVHGIPLGVAFVAPPLVIGGACLAYAIKRETRPLADGATTQQDAVRLLSPSPPWFFVSNRRFAERLIDAHGGHAIPGQQRQWDVAWSAVIAAGALLGVTWLGTLMQNNGDIMIDNGSRDAVSVWLDGERVAQVASGQNEHIHVRSGHHVIAWSTTNAPAHERAFELNGLHHYLYNPGATTCYWRTVDVYERRGPARAGGRKEAADDGPLEIAELYDLPQVDRWFEANPATKSLSNGQEYATDYAIVRDPSCTALVGAGCDKKVLDALLECETATKTAAEVTSCVETAKDDCSISEP
jgi:hypothetical protein